MRILYRERGHLVLDLRPLVYPAVEWAGYWYATLGLWLGVVDPLEEIRRGIARMTLEQLAEEEREILQLLQRGVRYPERLAEVRAMIRHRMAQLEEEVPP